MSLTAKFFLRLMLFFIPLFFNNISLFANEKVIWPIRESAIVTSGFMEDRSFRYHAGIDLRTWGGELPIYASEDGYVIRANISPWGYGRAIYIQGNSGKIYVYAHCSRFIPEIESLIRREQLKKSRYRVDFRIEPGQIPIRRGQLIGYSGSTGAGPPHLHFEIRDNLNRPLNPFNLGFSVLDTHPPVIASISIFPIDDTTLINGCENIKTLELSNAVDTVYIRGRVGISVLAWDLTSLNMDARLGVYECKLYLNDSLVFHQRYDKFSYSDTRYARYDKNYYVPGSRMIRADNLFIYELDNASFYQNTGMVYPNGIIVSSDINEGVKARIVVGDHAGNRKETTLFLKKDVETECTRLTVIEDLYRASDKITDDLSTTQYDNRRLAFDGRNIFIPENYFEENKSLMLDSAGIVFSFLFNSVIVSFLDNSPDYLVLINEEGGFNLRGRPNRKGEFIMPYHVIGRNNKFLLLRQSVFGTHFDGFYERKFYKISSDTSYVVELDDRHSLEVRKNMINRRASYFVIEEKNIVLNTDRFRSNDSFRSFLVRGRAVDFNSGFIFRYKFDNNNDSSFSIYTSGSRPGYVGGKLGNGYITANMNMNTALLHIRDIVNPVVVIEGVRNGVLYDKKPTLWAVVRDDESGIWSDTQIVTKVNNQIVINEYDPSSNRTRVIHPDRVIPGRNIFSVTVTDNQGNTTNQRVQFYYKNK